MSSRRIKLLSHVPKYSEQLQISKDSREIEDKLNTKLIPLVNQLQKLQMQGSDMFYNLDFRQRIDSAFRGGIEQIYKIAAAYAAEFSSRDYFTTRTDLDTINRITQTYVSLFFSRLQRFIIPGYSPEQGRLIKPEFIVSMTTATMTQDIMRQAIIAKSQQILNPAILTTAALEQDNAENAAIMDTILNPVVYVWVTSQDDRVCRICAGYEGMAWAYEDAASIPDIPDDTHLNCRCTLQLSEAEFMQ